MRALRRLVPAALLAGLVTLLVACGGDDDGTAEDSTDLTSAAGTATLRLAMQDIGYETAALTTKRGEAVRIEMENHGQLTHDFTVDGIAVTEVHKRGSSEDGEHAAHEPDLHFALDSGASGDLDFTPTEAGTYEYYCTVPGHREAGMHGTLTVE